MTDFYCSGETKAKWRILLEEFHEGIRKYVTRMTEFKSGHKDWFNRRYEMSWVEN